MCQFNTHTPECGRRTAVVGRVSEQTLRTLHCMIIFILSFFIRQIVQAAMCGVCMVCGGHTHIRFIIIACTAHARLANAFSVCPTILVFAIVLLFFYVSVYYGCKERFLSSLTWASRPRSNILRSVVDEHRVHFAHTHTHTPHCQSMCPDRRQSSSTLFKWRQRQTKRFSMDKCARTAEEH